jgi:oligopeptidase B
MCRGGTDCGYGWYDPNGKMFKKKNSFEDLITCAEFLVSQKFTSEGQIAIQVLIYI